MQLILIFIVIAGGMGLSIEAGLLGPLGGEVGDLWATFSICGVGAALTPVSGCTPGARELAREGGAARS